MLAVVAAQAALWSWAVLAVVVLLRVALALFVGERVLRDSQVLTYLWLLPVRDLVAVAVWIASFAGHTVTWRGDRFQLNKGRLRHIP